MPDDALDQTHAVLDLVRDLLGADALGVYLYGSAVAGGLRRRSDLDLFVVATRPTTPAEKRELVERLAPISRLGTRPPTWRPVELTIVEHAEIRPWRYPPRQDFLYGEWLREEYERGEIPLEPQPNPDLAVLVTTLRESSRPLLGPPAPELLDPVPPDALRRAMLDGIDGLLADLDGDERNVVLTLARIRATLQTGRILSKDEAAELVLERLPEEHRPVLARARAIYLDQEPEGWDDMADALRLHVDHAVAEIRRISEEQPSGRPVGRVRARITPPEGWQSGRLQRS